jgi:S-adenosylmethionine hydrolase
VGDREITTIRTAYGNAVGPGELFGILGSMGYLEIAANQSSAAQILGVGKGATVEVVLEANPGASPL